MSNNRQSLQRVTVSIPPEVADFMEAVWQMIEWHDERLERVSDDAIQEPNIAPVIGGLESLDSKWFTFRYTARKEPLTRWKLRLFENEIEDIAKRHVTKLLLWKCTQPTCHHLFTDRADVYCNCDPSPRLRQGPRRTDPT